MNTATTSARVETLRGTAKTIFPKSTRTPTPTAEITAESEGRKRQQACGHEHGGRTVSSARSRVDELGHVRKQVGHE